MGGLCIVDPSDFCFLNGSFFARDEQRKLGAIKPKPSEFYLINSVTRPWREVGAVGQSNNLLLPQLVHVPETER